MAETTECELCGKLTTEYCHDLVCRDCHKTESLESCMGNSQVNRIRKEYGLSSIKAPDA